MAIEYIVYKTVNKQNGRFYIGSHYAENAKSDSYLGSGMLIKKAIEKYGKESFERHIIAETNTVEELLRLEKYYIDSNINNALCYNLSPLSTGGDLGEFKYKPMLQIDLSGEIIKKWDSRLDAVKHVPKSAKCHLVSDYITCKNDENREHAAKFLWIYEDDYNKNLYYYLWIFIYQKKI
jgi:hypothetical protein